MNLDLYIGNKNYSSWSLRPWLLLKHLGIPFTEHMVSVAGRDYNPALRPISANARVPCLHVDGFPTWESLAIAEYLAEQRPELWPADPMARARARSISAEMHSGFINLRKAMPMNLKFQLKGKSVDAAVQRDIDRIVEIGVAVENILTVCAPPGFSEHHTGRAVDLSTPGCRTLEVEFDQTTAYAWLNKHAAEFGYYLSYPIGNSWGYQYEPWHWCFQDAQPLQCT